MARVLNCEHGYWISLKGLLHVTEWIHLTYNMSAKLRSVAFDSTLNITCISYRVLFFSFIVCDERHFCGVSQNSSH